MMACIALFYAPSGPAVSCEPGQQLCADTGSAKDHSCAFQCLHQTPPSIKRSAVPVTASPKKSAILAIAREENVPAEVYDNLVATVRKHIPAMHRYVRLRKKMLGVDALHFYDVYAPLVGDLKKSYSYETAQEMVLKAVAPLGEDYLATVRKAYAERWISSSMTI